MALSKEVKDMVAKADEAGVPRHLIPGLMDYIHNGVPTGSFLNAVLTNNLRMSVLNADNESRKGIVELVQFMWGEAPAKCWGSEERVRAWLDHGGLSGLYALLELYPDADPDRCLFFEEPEVTREE